jgi:hypothetical protein
VVLAAISIFFSFVRVEWWWGAARSRARVSVELAAAGSEARRSLELSLVAPRASASRGLPTARLAHVGVAPDVAVHEPSKPVAARWLYIGIGHGLTVA